jgi:tetratricopeptide (TPR) repeat protein
MMRHSLGALGALLALAASTSAGPPAGNTLIHQHWFEARTAHFHLYSCGSTQAVARLATRLEQFHDAYSLLAGAQAVASPPITVMAFPDYAEMKPFLPLYQGKPENLAGFFIRGSDENLIVLHLAGVDSLPRIFHEYAHLLMRHNAPYWPMWLNEGMAEIYAPFEVVGPYRARIGKPIEYHLRTLETTPLMPLKKLFAVGRESPEYNETQHQGLFYAESWLLAHYLMLGGNPSYQAGFRQLTPLLRQGQSPEQAFTNALHTTLPAMEAQLRRYIARGKFQSLDLSVGANLETFHFTYTRGLTPGEVCFRLGNQLFRIGRLETAESYFLEARELAPKSPLPLEGLGLLAAKRREPEQAVHFLGQSLQQGSGSFLAHYVYAQQKYALAAHAPDSYTRLNKESAAEIRAQLQKSLTLMPEFAPAHDLLGFFEMVQGEDLSAAQRHLAAAIQLEPENPGYQLTLAQVQLAQHDLTAARRTLEPLRRANMNPRVRARAEQMLQQINGAAGPGS